MFCVVLLLFYGFVDVVLRVVVLFVCCYMCVFDCKCNNLKRLGEHIKQHKETFVVVKRKIIKYINNSKKNTNKHKYIISSPRTDRE